MEQQRLLIATGVVLPFVEAGALPRGEVQVALHAIKAAGGPPPLTARRLAAALRALTG